MSHEEVILRESFSSQKQNKKISEAHWLPVLGRRASHNKKEALIEPLAWSLPLYHLICNSSVKATSGTNACLVHPALVAIMQAVPTFYLACIV